MRSEAVKCKEKEKHGKKIERKWERVIQKEPEKETEKRTEEKIERESIETEIIRRVAGQTKTPRNKKDTNKKRKKHGKPEKSKAATDLHTT